MAVVPAEQWTAGRAREHRGRASELAALRAYGAVIALLPDDADHELPARPFAWPV
ncbi:hypothetical protein [Streptomyces sp. NPDC096132]|uniref:hypothetical protein n=1 Tax=Streptomyces sp. NPDC096132 TaxID=3366075 RepID=UPI0038014F51